MIPVLLGLLAALCWSLHDLLVRIYAPRIGAFRLAVWVMLAGGLFLIAPVFITGKIWSATPAGLVFACSLGASYALAVGGLYKAFSLAPVSVVGPLTAGYPALVVVWGLLNGLTPTWLQWLAMVLIMAGAFIVSRSGDEDGGVKSVAAGKLPTVFFACALACLGFAVSIILGQEASAVLGEVETTLVSRFPAALLLLPFARREPVPLKPVLSAFGWTALAAMALADIIAVSAVNYSGQFENKEFGALSISAYAALSVLLAMIFLREKVSTGQWIGIALIVFGIGVLGWPKT